MTDKTLWEEFNLAEGNPDQGGGILYAMRYSAGRIKAHREAVVGALQESGIDVREWGDLLALVPRADLSEYDQRRVYVLAEELSVLNEAAEYHEKGFGRFKNVAELKDGLVSAYVSLLQDKKLADAYDLVTTTIPQVVRDLRISDAQAKPFSARERQTIRDLLEFAVTRERQLDHPRVLLFG